MSSERRDIYIVGAGGFGRETVETIRDINKENMTYNVVGFIDDDETKWGNSYNDTKVLGGIEYLLNVCKTTKPYCVISIANGDVKEKMFKKLDGFVEWCNLIHPTVVKWSNVEMGVGNVFQPYVFIGPNAKIGNHVLVNIKSNIGHDVIVGDYSSLMCFCDLTGEVELKEKVFVASHASVIPKTVVGESAKLGAGSVIIKDVRPGVTMHGHMAVEAEKK